MDKAAKWKAANPVAQIEVLPRGARAAYIHKPLYNRHKACTFASCAMSLQQLLPAVAWQGQAAEDFRRMLGIRVDAPTAFYPKNLACLHTNPMEFIFLASAGAQPCSVCGQWTFSFCETCCMTAATLPPWAVCSCCDSDGLVCPTCRSQTKCSSFSDK